MTRTTDVVQLDHNYNLSITITDEFSQSINVVVKVKIYDIFHITDPCEKKKGLGSVRFCPCITPGQSIIFNLRYECITSMYDMGNMIFSYYRFYYTIIYYDKL